MTDDGSAAGTGAAAPAPRLFTPGPTELPQAVRTALATPLVPARTPTFMGTMASIAARLRQVFLTAGDVVTLTCSGTGALEAAFVNLISPGDRILVAHAGKFGERWLELARAHGIECLSLEAPWGQAIQPESLAAALRDADPLSAVFLTQSETSTGVVHDVAALAATVHELGEALVIVDAVSSAGAIPLHTDAWGLDAVVSASHKGLLCPPGLAFVALGSRALQRCLHGHGDGLPRYYFDLRPALDGLDAGGTPWTPAVSLAHALSASLDHLLSHGLESIWSRTHRLARATRAGAVAAGLDLFATPPGDIVTAARVPDGFDARRVVRELRARGFEVAAGQSAIKRQVFRIAHLGDISDRDLLALMDALEQSLKALDLPVVTGAPRSAALAVLEEGHTAHP